MKVTDNHDVSKIFFFLIKWKNTIYIILCKARSNIKYSVFPIISPRPIFSFIFSFVVVWPNFENIDYVYQLCSGL